MSVETTEMIGQTISNGRYEIVDHIGTGSMGHVYRAFDKNLEAHVCVKIPTSSRLSDPDFARRFELESRLLVKLQHPQVVNVIDVGFENDTPYIVMQYVGGGSLLDRMQDDNGVIMPQKAKQLKYWLPSVAKALDFMHTKDCIHRDVKPANILFDEHNNAYLSDFGLSKILMEEDTGNDNNMTAKGAVVGTPNYVAPEIVLGRPYDGRADQYSLAITVYEYLTATAPMEGPSASATMVNQTTKQPLPITKFNPDIPIPLNAAVLQGMAKKSQNRFACCEDFADAVMAAALSSSSSMVYRKPRKGDSSATNKSSRPAKYIVKKTSKAVSPGKIPCPNCDKKLVVSAQYAGQQATCNGCQCRLRISNDLEELHLLEDNPNFNSDIHQKGREESDHFDTVLKTEVFGRSLSQRQASILVGATLLMILVGAIWVGQGLNQESVQEQTKGSVRTFSREGSSDDKVVKIPVKASYTIVPSERGWYRLQHGTFQRLGSVNTDIQSILEYEKSETTFDKILSLIEKEPETIPSVISPRSQIEMLIIQQKWSELYPEQKLFSREEVIYSSPLVCLMWQDRFFEFQKKYSQVNLRTVLDAAVNDQDWNTISGKPDWGLFRFAMPGFEDARWGDLFLVTAVQQYAKTDSPITEADLSDSDIKEQLKRIDKLAVNPRIPGDDSLRDISEAALKLGPDYADVIITTEQEALRIIPELEKKWAQFIQISYLDYAPWHARPIGIAANSSQPRIDGANTFVNHLLNSESMRELLNTGFRPQHGNISPFESERFSRYRLRGVKENPPKEIPLPDGKVLDTLKETYERIHLQN